LLLIKELDVQVTITYSLGLSVSAVVPSSVTTNLQTMDLSGTFYVIGNTFRPIYPNIQPICRIGNQTVTGNFLPNDNGTGM
jgi:hypothetical protein